MKVFDIERLMYCKKHIISMKFFVIHGFNVEATRMVLQSPTLLGVTWILKFEIFFRELNWPWGIARRKNLASFLAPYFSSLFFLEGKWDPMDREIQVGEIL